MKNFYTFALSIVFSVTLHSQNAFWTETFGTGCDQGQGSTVVATPSNGAWATTSFSLPFMNGPEANEWFISSSEQGQLVGVCGGITCGGSNNRTLHIGRNKPIPPPGVVDVGASYFGGFLSHTNKRAETPVIDCSGRDFIQLSFTYILGGIPNADYCDIECSADGGATWTVVTTIPPSNNTSCGLQGEWSFFAVGLPTSCSNNPNVKVGFHWYNNDPTGGSPSVAIDEMRLSELTIATSATVGCLTATSTASISNLGIGNTTFTWSSSPNTVTFSPSNASVTTMQFPGLGTYTIIANSGTNIAAPTSTAMEVVSVIFGSTPSVSAVSSNSILCTGQTATITASNATTYTWNTSANTSTITVSPSSNTTYTVTGTNGNCVSTFTIEQVVDPCTGLNEFGSLAQQIIFPNPFTNALNILSTGETEVALINMLGKIIAQEKFMDELTLQTSDLPKGIYFLNLRTGKGGNEF